MQKNIAFYMQDYFLTTFKLLKFRIKKIQKTEISNIILSFKDRKKLIADLESGLKIGSEGAQHCIGHDTMT